MGKKCPICGEKIRGMFYKFKACDGRICGGCSALCDNYEATPISKMKEYWEANNRRVALFTQTGQLSDFASETINIDHNHSFFYLGKELGKRKFTPVIYSFDEVMSYYTQQVGQQTVTTTKGGVGRAVVGGTLFGAAGAIVGANTARTETHTTGGFNALYISFDTYAGRRKRTVTSFPLSLPAFLDSCIDERNKKANAPAIAQLSVADEIMQYKSLLDEGAITQDEFDEMKKKILSKSAS